LDSYTTRLPPGKVPGELLSRLISRYVRDDPSVIIGPGIGRDAAALALGDRILVVKTDPITFATNDAGRYLVNVNANDIACMGATPRWLLVTALLPETTTTPQLLDDLFRSLSEAANELDIALVGGHSEITIGLDRPILVGQMIGEAQPRELVDSRRVEPSDALILTGGIAIEGTSILAAEARSELASLPTDLLESAVNFIHTPGISVLPAIRALKASKATLRALHDPTEGGIMTAISEVAAAAGLPVEVNIDSIPVLPESAAICKQLDLDPLGLIASGALLAAVPESEVNTALRTLHDHGIVASRIGHFLSSEASSRALVDGTLVPWPTFAVDEIARFFARPTHG
jgi:hydrogenase expression/formation protein HypE